MACGIVVPRPGIEPTPLAVEAQSLNHWTAREVPDLHSFYLMSIFLFQVPIRDITLHLVVLSLVCSWRISQEFPRFLYLKIFGNTSHVFCRMSLKLGLSNAFLLIRLGFSERIPQR